MGEARLEFKGVRKVFRMRNRSAALRDAVPRLLGSLLGRPHSPEEPFVALDDVSFSVAPGEVLGIVGLNGAGKSTSLRLAAGIYRADAGTVRVGGRVAALIELSAGFHPDLSGRENVFLAGALVGLRKREIEGVFDEIVEFAGIGEFLDSPVHTYSSGMAMRLGFSVAAHVPAEIMLVDEVLAVGDIEFQVKCIRRMSERKREGASILFVSHHMPTVEQFCDRVLFVNHGKVLAKGPPREAIGAYRQFVADQARQSEGKGGPGSPARKGTGVLFLDHVKVEGDPGLAPGVARHRGILRIAAEWTALRPVPRPVLGAAIHTVEGALCAELTSAGTDGVPGEFCGKGTMEVICSDLALLPGDYVITVFAKDQAAFSTLDRHEKLYPLEVVGDVPPGQGGMVSLRPKWSVRAGEPTPGRDP